jgi:hypothetical protein
MDYAVEGSEEWNRCKSIQIPHSNSFSNPSSVEAAIGRWDRKFKRPIMQNNQVVNPSTGLYEEAGQEGTYFGPPCIDLYVHNLQREPSMNQFQSLQSTIFATLDEVLAEIGEHVRNAEYKIYSIAATTYSVTLVLLSARTVHDLGAVFSNTQSKLNSSMLERIRLSIQEEESVGFFLVLNRT